jgi:rhodanese-related sulfurtransferase
MRIRRRHEVTPADVAERDLPVIDVREADEWTAGRIDGALHIPMGQVPERLDEIPDDETVAVICRSGQRSGRVAAWLRHQGYDAVNVTGGMQAWQKDGRQTSTGGEL